MLNGRAGGGDDGGDAERRDSEAVSATGAEDDDEDDDDDDDDNDDDNADPIPATATVANNATAANECTTETAQGNMSPIKRAKRARGQRVVDANRPASPVPTIPSSDSTNSAPAIAEDLL